MDGGTVEEAQFYRSIASIFERDCPYFMSLGMTYEEYWYGNPLLVRSYLQAEEYRRRKENYNLWLGGIYMQQAIASTIGNAFIEKGSPKNKYPDKPFPIDEETLEQDRVEQEAMELEATRAYMLMLADQGREWDKKRLAT